jgi:general secretion pathway protein H
MASDDGFTLIEMVCVLAIMALMAALVFPAIQPGTTPAEVDAYAMRIASLLKADRYAAMRSGSPVATLLNAHAKTVKSGAGSGWVQLPAGIGFDAVLAKRCSGVNTSSGIAFFPSGMSCGGVIALARPGLSVEIRVNWLTGGVEIVSAAKS